MESYFESIRKFEEKLEIAETARMTFSRTGDGRLVPHLDFIEVLKRGFRIAGLPVAFSRGFNKREKISTGYPVPLGFESVSELVDVELFRKLSMEEQNDYAEKINKSLPSFIRLNKIRGVEHGQSLMALVNAVEYEVLFTTAETAALMLEHINRKEDVVKRGKSGVKTFTFDEAVYSFEASGETGIKIILYAGNEASLRADDFFYELSGIKDYLVENMRVTKQAQYSLKSGTLEIVE